MRRFCFVCVLVCSTFLCATSTFLLGQNAAASGALGAAQDKSSVWGLSRMASAGKNAFGLPDWLLPPRYRSGSLTAAGSVGSLVDPSTLFAPPVNYPAGLDVLAVAVADVNGDGKPDILVATVPSANYPNRDGALGVLLGNGDGTFQAVVLYDSGGEGTGALAVADVNGDGKPDVLMANYCGTDNAIEDGCAVGSGTASVLLGNGDGTFQPAVPYDTAFGPDALAVADVNGDGKPDLIVTNSELADEYYGGGTVGVYLGNGDGTFQGPNFVGSGGWDADGVVVADVNGDGKPDLVVLNECNLAPAPFYSDCSTGAVAVFLGNGDGTFQAPVIYSSGANGGISLAVGDVNGDGKPDLLVMNECLNVEQCSDGGALAVMLGNGDGTFQAPVVTPVPPNSYYGIALADFNGDGKLDVATSLGVLLGNGNGTFQNFVSYDIAGPNIEVAVGDLNGDGKPDLVAGDEFGDAIVLLNTSRASETTATLVSSSNPSKAGKCATFVATVSSGAAGTLTGKVQFRSGTTVLGTRDLNGGRAVFDINDLPIGRTSVTAVYEGSAKFRSSTSGVVNQEVLGTTTTTLTASPNPSVYGQSVTFTATVSSGEGTPADGESVSFMDGKTLLGTETLSGGSASFTTSGLKVGTALVTAVYGGDSNFEGSTSKDVKQVVGK
jgi:Bacterial Ig-like domain (group 3)/FG-GAP-like repeat/FG-GAP repeat